LLSPLQAESLIRKSSLAEIKEAFLKVSQSGYETIKIICKQQPENLNKPV